MDYAIVSIAIGLIALAIGAARWNRRRRDDIDWDEINEFNWCRRLSETETNATDACCIFHIRIEPEPVEWPPPWDDPCFECGGEGGV